MRLTIRFLVTILIYCLFLCCRKKENQAVPGIPSATTGSIKPSDAVIYELYVRDFSSEGTFSGVLPRLDSLKALGVNVIWFVPINPYGKLNFLGPYGSPYCIMNYYDVNPEYGTMSDFDNLVSTIHSKGMEVMLDWVADHTSWDNPWITGHPSWYLHNTAGQIISPIPAWTDVAGLDYTNTVMQDSMIALMKMWVVKHNIDGYRCDAADMIPDAFWTRCIDTLNTLGRSLILLAEGDKASHYTSGFQLTYSWNFFTALGNVFNAGNYVSLIATTYSSEMAPLQNGNYKLLFTTNHDEDYTATPLQLYGGKAGAEAASIITACLSPVPLLYNGQEVGDSLNINMSYIWPINWNANTPMRLFYEKLYSLYSNNEVLRYGTTVFYNVSNDVILFLKQFDGQSVVVVVNVRNQKETITLPPLMANAKLQDALSGYGITDSIIQLNPYQGMVLVP